jgi:hypothetical protein
LAPQAPQLQTKTLPPAIRRQLYLSTIIAEDTDEYDNITASITGLPQGIALDLCKPTQTVNQKRMMSCTISGNATAKTGIYPVTVVLTDSYNLVTRYTINLEVVSNGSIFELF